MSQDSPLTSLGEGDGHVRACEFLAASLILEIEKAMLVHLDHLPRSKSVCEFCLRGADPGGSLVPLYLSRTSVKPCFW